jgi:penicillin-binding protein 2
MEKYFVEQMDEGKEYSSRFRYLYGVVAVVTFIIISRLWYLQIVEGQELRDFSEKNRVKETKKRAPRGLMFDREGRVLVDNKPGFELVIIPQHAERLAESAEEISIVTKIPAETIITSVKQSRRKNGPFRPVKIKDNLTIDEIVALKRIRFDHPGVEINDGILRSYPLQENGAQLLGYVGEISKSQIDKMNVKFRGTYVFDQGDIIGKGGLEEQWEGLVRGIDGLSFTEVDAHGRLAPSENSLLMGINPQEPVPGKNLVLTIDLDIQNAAYQAMKNQKDWLGDRNGSLIAMRSNGEVLAWLSKPSYDPNNLSQGITTDLWNTLINHPAKPLRNKVIQDHYAPGSTFKPFVALAALQENIIKPQTSIYAAGSMRFGNRTYHDSLKQGHGNVNVAMAIEASSNIFFYRMGIALGIDRISKYSTLFGFGQRTGVGLINERSGLMPNSEWKKKTYGEDWQPGENLSNAIGQGFVLATGIQLAVAFNTIGLEGEVVQPYIVKQVIDSENNVLQEFQPKVVRDISKPNDDNNFISKDNFKVVKKGLEGVANGPRGTARWWKLPGVKFAGKTGTTQVMSFSADDIYTKCESRPLRFRHHGWFIGYAPADKPEITIAVFAEHGCHGSTGAVPVVRDTMLAFFKKYYPDKLKADAIKIKAVESPPAVEIEE